MLRKPWQALERDHQPTRTLCQAFLPIGSMKGKGTIQDPSRGVIFCETGTEIQTLARTKYGTGTLGPWRFPSLPIGY